MKDRDLENTIREALTAEQNEWANEIDPGMHEMIIEVFQGKSRWFATLGFIITLVFLGIAVFSLSRFFQAESTRELVAWATTFMFCATTISMVKIWYWMEMSKNAVTREIKRFELQLARVTKQLDDA